MSATPQGVEDSIHDRLMAIMEETPEVAVEETQDTDEVSAEAVEAEPVTDEVVESEETESVEAEPSEIEAQEAEPSEPAQAIELSHIAEYLGATEDQFSISEDGDLLVNTKIDGEVGQAKFSELLKSYQLEGHLNKQSTELAESQKALQTKLDEADGQLAQKVQQLEDLSQLAYNQLLSDFNKVNWDELRSDDPAEWSAKQTDYQNRQSEIANLYQKAQDSRGELAATKTEAGKGDIAEQTTKLIEAFPTWKDPEVNQREWKAIGDYAVSQGMALSSYSSNTDHSLIVMLDKAMKFDALKKESPKIANRVRKAPKIAQPGSTAGRIPSEKARVDKLHKQLKRDGGGNALHELLLDIV